MAGDLPCIIKYTVQRKYNNIEIQFKVYVTSFKNVRSRDRLPVLVYGSKEGSDVVSVTKLAYRSFGLLVTSIPGCGCLRNLLHILKY